MSIFKCKMCGGTLEFNPGDVVGVCDSCGTKQTLPNGNDEIIANLHNRANSLRLKCDFDKAEETYNKILETDPKDAEAHWGIILCKYGIEYVEDPRTGKRVPTCHRTSFDAVLADDDYKAALTNAVGEQKTLYEAEAKEIDRIQKDILSIVKNEKPFDVFICYKETDVSGKRTQDSVIANDIYYQLTQEGFKVFYAAITLENKIGSEYEPYIFAALNSAKVMLVVGSKPEYFNAVWVKNEWSRFLKLMKTDRKKLLIPCYRDMDAYELPEEFAHLQAQDMNKIGFINDIVRGIKKVVSDSASKSEPKDAPTVNTANANIAPLLKRVFMFLEDGKWQDAEEYCEKVLDLEPENAEAYIGKLMAELKVKKESDLASLRTPIDEMENYKKAIRFADESTRIRLMGYLSGWKRLLQEVEEVHTQLAEFLSSVGATDRLKRVKKDKDEAVSAIKKEISSLEHSKMHFGEMQVELEDLKAEMDRLTVQKEKELRSIETMKKELSSLGLFSGRKKKERRAQISDARASLQRIESEITEITSKYNSKSETFGMLGSREDIRRKIDSLNSEVEKSDKAFEETIKTYEKEIKIFEDNVQRGQFDFEELKRKLCDRAIRKYLKGKKLRFGEYWQSSLSVGKAPIEWIVLGVSSRGGILLLSDKALACKPYNTTLDDVTWETCSLRKWLNGTFLDDAFNAEEQALIQRTTVSADRNPEYDTNPGNDTTDKVFLLSITEAEECFDNDKARKCAPTAYAMAQVADTIDDYADESDDYTIADESDDYETEDGSPDAWWLRSPGNYQFDAANVFGDGSVYSSGFSVHCDFVCVRPALWIKLES